MYDRQEYEQRVITTDDLARIRTFQLEAYIYGDPESVTLCERAQQGDLNAAHAVLAMLDYYQESLEGGAA